MNPPLRAEDDRAGAGRGARERPHRLRRHRPRAARADEQGGPLRGGGLRTTGLETAFAVALHRPASRSGALDLARSSTRMSQAPARDRRRADRRRSPRRRGRPLRRRPARHLDGRPPTACSRARPTAPSLGRELTGEVVLTVAAGTAGVGGRCLSPALIVLEDGATFTGEALAGRGTVGGEFVFNTSMTGYQEIVTDPSYAGQVMTFTFPMNGQLRRASARATNRPGRMPGPSSRASSPTTPTTARSSGTLARVARRARRPRRERRRHARPHAPLREQGCAARPSSPTDGADRQVAARARPRPAGDGRPRPRRRGQLRGAVRAPAAEATDRERLHVVAFDFGIKRAMLGYLRRAGMRGDRRPGPAPAPARCSS